MYKSATLPIRGLLLAVIMAASVIPYGCGKGSGRGITASLAEFVLVFADTAVLIPIDNSQGPSVIVITRQGDGGRVVITATGDVKYTPNSCFSGNDTFGYRQTINGISATGEVSVEVLTPLVTDEIEPNDTPATATLLDRGAVLRGELSVAGDVDCFEFPALAGEVISIELLAVRLDAASWDLACSAPELTVRDPLGVSVLRHDFGAWGHGQHDLDVPMIPIDAGGDYTVCIDSKGGVAAGEFAVTVKAVDLRVTQKEAELPGTSGDNDSIVDSEAIEPGLLQGFFVDGESDFYSFEITEPTRIYFEVSSYRNGISDQDDDYFDSMLVLWKDGATVLAFNDDAFFLDSAISYLLTSPGTYFVEVRESFGDGDADYLLSFEAVPTGPGVEDEPNDDTGTANAAAPGEIVGGEVQAGNDDFFSFEGEAGDLVRVWLFDTNHQAGTDSVDPALIAPDGATELFSDVGTELRVLRTILQEGGTFSLRIRAAGGDTTYAFRVDVFAAASYEAEPNNSAGDAGVIGVSCRTAGVIETIGDEDFYAFTAVEDEMVTLAVYAETGFSSDGHFELSRHGSKMLPSLRVLDGGGVTLASARWRPATGCSNTESVTNALATLELSFIAPAEGDYHVVVSDQEGGFGDQAYYVLEKR